MTKKHTFGSITLPEGSGGPFVPTLMPYKESGKILETLAFAVQENMPVLLVGETGVGKTAAIRHLAATTNTSLRRVNINGSMTAEDFVGQVLVRSTDEGGTETYWKDGVLTECMRNGYWIVLDEVNAASAEILFVLHSLMDDDKYIVLTDHPDREIVHAHKDFRIFGTMNPPERYAGTKQLNRALQSRFGMTITVPIPSAAIEYGTIADGKKLTKTAVQKLRAFTTELRTAYAKEEIDVFLSPRDTANILRVYSFTGELEKAIELVVASRGTDAEHKAIMTMARVHFGGKAKESKATSSVPF